MSAAIPGRYAGVRVSASDAPRGETDKESLAPITRVRFVQVVVPDSRREQVIEMLEDEEIDFVATASANGNGIVVEFPLPPQAVEYVLERLGEAGIDEDDHTVVLRAETALTERYDALEERFVHEVEDDDSVARDELRATARDMLPGPAAYYAMTLLSALVAAVGLLIDSAAVVVGSMVIAPQVGSALTGSLGVVLDERRLIVDGVRTQFLGLALAILGTTGFGFLVRAAEFVPPIVDVTTIAAISERVAPGALTLGVGLAAGAAGAVGLATALPVSLVGVMIAAALIPAAATVGIGLAWGYPSVSLGALVLLLVNLAAVNLAAALVFWFYGYRPDDWVSGDLMTDLARHWRGPAAVVVVLFAVTFGGLCLLVFDQATHETEVNEGTQEFLDEGQYHHLTLVSVRVGFGDRYLNGRQEVTVVVERPPDKSYPDVATELAVYLTQQTGTPTDVTVEFRDRVDADVSASTATIGTPVNTGRVLMSA
jgi:uncharacterized hydrophobic protein (TIGR00341 family)